jgi:hypothetical protein
VQSIRATCMNTPIYAVKCVLCKHSVTQKGVNRNVFLHRVSTKKWKFLSGYFLMAKLASMIFSVSWA